MKPRHNLYLDEALIEQLDALASRPGGSKSAIVSDALRAWLARRAATEIDDLLRVRLEVGRRMAGGRSFGEDVRSRATVPEAGSRAPGEAMRRPGSGAEAAGRRKRPAEACSLGVPLPS